MFNAMFYVENKLALNCQNFSLVFVPVDVSFSFEEQSKCLQKNYELQKQVKDQKPEIVKVQEKIEASSLQNDQKKHQPKSTKFLPKTQYRKQKKKLISIRKQEHQFKPYTYQQKKPKVTRQNNNRNVIPNIIHQILSYIQKQSKSYENVESLLEKYKFPENFTVKRFYIYQKNIKNILNAYVNLQTLNHFKRLQDQKEQIFSIKEQMAYNKISRMLIYFFLRQQLNNIILTSKRINSKKKGNHLSARRELLKILNQFFTDQDSQNQ